MKERPARLLLGSALVIGAVFTFWLIFFILTPLIANQVPSGEWQGFMRILVYAAVGYLGGIGIPIGLLILAAYAWWVD